MKTRAILLVATLLIARAASAGEQRIEVLPPQGGGAPTSTLQRLPRGQDCGRAAFEHIVIYHEYDLEKEVSSLDASRGTNGINEARMAFAARSMASLLQVPVKSTASQRSERIEMAYMRSGKRHDDRKNWAQLLARFVPGDTQWLLTSDGAPDRMTIYRDGVEHFWLKEDSMWTVSESPRGVFLIPRFEQFGSLDKYVDSEHSDTNRWVLAVTSTGGVIRTVWRSTPARANREVGVEVMEGAPDQVSKAWWGKIDAPSHIETYSNYVAVAGGVLYPTHSHFVTQLPLVLDKPLVLKEERYTVLGTNVLLDCSVDPLLFEPTSYPWSAK